MSKDDSGGAFPNIWFEDGMTLRDWFAGQALAGADFDEWREYDHLARHCYQVADAMLAAREATQ